MLPRVWHSIFTLLILATLGHAQAGLPARLDELPRLAKDWPKSWAILVSELNPKRADFARDAVQRIDGLLREEPAKRETFPIAETVLAAVLRHDLATQRNAPTATHTGQDALELQRQLSKLRTDWLNYLRSNGHTDEANRLANQWLPTTTKVSPERSAIAQLWMHQAAEAIKNDDYQTARMWVDKADAYLLTDGSADQIRKQLHERAQALFKEAQALPKAEGMRLLQDAVAIWPRLPGARDELARRNGTFRTLVVGVPALPEQMSPATAWTYTEKQVLSLLFDRLCQVEVDENGKHYRSHCAEIPPSGSGLWRLNRQVYWSNGEPVTATDIRHTALLTDRRDSVGRHGLWRDYLDVPVPQENPFHVNISLRQGLLDPLAPLTFHLVPQYFHKNQLGRTDDAEFAKAPLGSGPFHYVSRKVEDGRIYAVFHANPHDLRGEPRLIREVRMVAWTDPEKDLAKAQPDLLLDAPREHLASLKKLGYTEVRGLGNSGVSVIAVNHRRAALKSQSLRRALSQAIDRKGLLDRHFAGGTPSNSPFPRRSWAICPAPRVPEMLFQLEAAKSSAGQVSKDRPVAITLKHAAGDASVQAACNEIAQRMQAVLTKAGVPASLEAVALAPRHLQKSLHERDYDLLYLTETDLDDPVRLSLLFDVSPDASSPGGSNYLGYEGDIKLQELLRAAVKHRQFSVAQSNMHAVHAHLYETMPMIPLWQLDTHILSRPNLRIPTTLTQDVFAHIRDWKITP